MPNLKLTVAGDSNVGIVRKNNEDYLTYFIPGDPQVIDNWGRLFIVADGVGGAAMGEVASKFATLKTLYTYYSQATMKPWQRIKVGMKHANTELVNYIRQNAQARMATTMVAAAINEDEMTIVNVGDSRAYLLRNQEITMLTQDHNLVNEMIRNGVLTEEQAKTAKVKNQLTSSLGGHELFKADVFVETLQPGDLVLLASDGLCRYAEDVKIIKKLMRSGTPQKVVDNCINFGRKNGGQDNITALLIRVDGTTNDALPLQEDRGTRPDPVRIEEVVKDPLTMVARSPEQENKTRRSSKMKGLFQPTPAPAISITEAYAIPGINMAANDEELEDTGDLTQTINHDKPAETEALIIGPVDIPDRPVLPAERLPKSGEIKDKQKGIQRISVKGYAFLIALAVLLFAALAVVGVIFGRRFWNGRNDNDLPATPVETIIKETISADEADVAPEEEIVQATITPQISSTPIPTQEPTAETIQTLSNGICLVRIDAGDSLKDLLQTQFGQTYEPAQDYYYYECTGTGENLTCGDAALISNHSNIQAGWFLEVADVEYETCLNNGGSWALEN